MAQVSESRPTSSAQPNIQDVFLNHARRDRLAVVIHLMDGRHLDARIKSFDRFAVIVEIDGADHLIFKHAIATIETRGRSRTTWRRQTTGRRPRTAGAQAVLTIPRASTACQPEFSRVILIVLDGAGCGELPMLGLRR